MQIAIVGLARSGKTTVFNTLTRGTAETGGFGGMTVNVGVVKVPDERLTRLTDSTLGESERIFYLGLRIPKGTSFMAPEHRGLIDTLNEGRGDEAAQIAAEHVRHSRTMMMDAILDSTAIQTTNIAAFTTR